jgi:thiopurine S-methyltransferase
MTSLSKDSDSVPRVLVPMCGRDISIAWIARQDNIGAVGIDFVDEPLRRLGNEIGGLVPLIDEPSRMSAYQGALEHMKRVILVHGDFFLLEEADYGGRFEAVWDRAALTAVEPVKREEYVAKLYRLLSEGGVMLVEALTCNVKMAGAMEANEPARILKQGGFSVQMLEDKDVRASYPDFDVPGIVYLREQVILARKEGPVPTALP